MKITAILLLVGIMQLSAATYGQKITLSENNTRLELVLKKIKAQSGFNFLYADDQLNNAKKVNVHLVDISLSEALAKVFEGQPLDFEIKEHTVIVKEKVPSFLTRLVDRFADFPVSGVVLDAEGKALAGATVSIKGSIGAVITDDAGKFYIPNVSEKNTLVISYLGFQTQEIEAKDNKAILHIKMVPSTEKLQDVIVNAGYYTVKEEQRTGSIARITSKDIETQPVSNVLATMQGRMAGVNIVQTSGVPGGGFKVQIRGRNSIRSEGNAPLYVIDGVPYSSETLNDNLTSGGIILEGNGPLNSINPNDVESIEVLKDADATAIYGSRGANGVILISTKTGKPGEPNFMANVTRGFGKISRFMDYMNTDQYLKMRKEAFSNDGISVIPGSAYEINGTWDENSYTDWQKELIGGTSNITNFESLVSGGTGQTRFLLNGNYRKETTVFPGDFNYLKGNLRATISHESDNKRLKLRLTSGYSAQNNSLPGSDLTFQVNRLAPNAPSIYDESGSLNWAENTWTNPFAELDVKVKSKTFDLITNGVASFQLFKGLEIKSSFGFNDSRHKESKAIPSTIYNPSWEIGSELSSFYLNTKSIKSWIIEPQLSWNKVFGEARINAIVGTTFQNQSSAKLVHIADGFSNNSLIENMAAASNLALTNDEQIDYKYQALYSRLNLNWKDRYILNLTGRRDGSSRFGPGNQFANFGAVGAAWLFSNEKFVKDKLRIFSFGKFRGSYGITGSDQIGDNQFLDTYTSSGNNYQNITGLQPIRLFNSDFGWETNKKLEVSIELGFLQDRLFLTSSYFRNRSSNQLVGIPQPASTGFSSIQANLDATVQNSGLEITLRTVNYQKTNFSWTTDFNLTLPKNQLVSFPGLENSTYSNQFIVGQPLNILKAYHFSGLNTETGIYQFLDANGDGIISPLEDKTVIKNLDQRYFGGVNNQINFKGWQMDFLFQFVNQEKKNSDFSSGVQGSRLNQSVRTLERWQKPGDDTPYQKYTAGFNSEVVRAYSRYGGSDAAISDGSYIRLKNVSLAYVLPKKITKDIQTRVSLQGQNVITISKFKGNDPEIEFSSYLPTLRMFTAGIQLIF